MELEILIDGNIHLIHIDTQCSVIHSYVTMFLSEIVFLLFLIFIILSMIYV